MNNEIFFQKKKIYKFSSAKFLCLCKKKKKKKCKSVCCFTVYLFKRLHFFLHDPIFPKGEEKTIVFSSLSIFYSYVIPIAFFFLAVKYRKFRIFSYGYVVEKYKVSFLFLLFFIKQQEKIAVVQVVQMAGKCGCIRQGNDFGRGKLT